MIATHCIVCLVSNCVARALINLLLICGDSKLRLRVKLTFGSAPSYYNVQVTVEMQFLRIITLFYCIFFNIITDI